MTSHYLCDLYLCIYRHQTISHLWPQWPLSIKGHIGEGIRLILGLFLLEIFKLSGYLSFKVTDRHFLVELGQIDSGVKRECHHFCTEGGL